MISCEKFCEIYWAHYISLEKELTSTLRYVTLDTNNYHTYSEAYFKLLLEIGSEVDVVLKAYCELLDSSFNGDKIGDYRICINSNKPVFFNQEVIVYEDKFTLKPWHNYDSSGNLCSPFWWTAYNKCKHNRADTGCINGITQEYFKFANLEYALNALAGLYQTILYAYKIIADSEGKTIKIPLPGSRLFKLNGTEWQDVQFYGDSGFYCENGTFYIESSTIHY